MIDLSTLKKDYKLHFRCGGEAVNSQATTWKKDGKIYFDDFEWGQGIKYQKDGRLDRGDLYNAGKEIHPFDIIKITPAGFDWDTVKPGTGFVSNHTGSKGKVLTFEAWSTRRDGFGGDIALPLAIMLTERGAYKSYARDYLTLAPEHDIEVAG